jgi:hypothetical protein
MSTPTVIESTSIAQNFNDWNAMQNHFNLKVVDADHTFPKWLLIRAWNEFKRLCKQYHIDWTKYKFARVTCDDPIWHVDFLDSDQSDASGFQLYEIYYDSRTKSILQRCFSIL